MSAPLLPLLAMSLWVKMHLFWIMFVSVVTMILLRLGIILTFKVCFFIILPILFRLLSCLIKLIPKTINSAHSHPKIRSTSHLSPLIPSILIISSPPENTVVHTDVGVKVTIGKNCTIGHNAIIHGCTLGDNVLIGMGAIIMNNAVIGSNSIVGAGALVTENAKIEPGQLVIGSPAKPVKPTSQAMIDGIQRSAEGYVQKIPQFRALTFVSPIILDQEPTKDV